MSAAWDAECDAAGLICPLPVLRARKALMRLGPGKVLRVVASDPMAAVDLPHFCAEAGHRLLAADAAAGGLTAYLIRRGG